MSLSWPPSCVPWLVKFSNLSRPRWAPKRAGASRQIDVLRRAGIDGSGRCLGAIVGVPVPVIGSVLAAILFGGIGATAGAMYGEWTDGRSWKENWTIGHAAFWGRTFGMFGKISAGLVILVIAFVGVII